MDFELNPDPRPNLKSFADLDRTGVDADLAEPNYETALRAKSSLRLKYEAETEVIRRKIGDLESIRSQLGLSQRKMAQLLMVDPSAWTRWTKGGENVPPHIYRMLTWYLALEDKYPALDVNFWLNTVAQVSENSRIPEIEAQADRLEAKVSENVGKVLSLEDKVAAVSRSLNESFLVSIRQEMDRREKQTRVLITWLVGLFSLLVFGLAGLVFFVS